MSAHWSTTARRSGFSLLEIVVVLAILGVIATVTVPAFRDARTKTESETRADQLLSLIDRTRRTAESYGARATLTVEVSTLRYWVTVRAGVQERTVAEGVMALGGGDLVAAEPRATFRFESDGRSTATTIAVRAGGETVPVFVDPWTGEARAGAR